MKAKSIDKQMPKDKVDKIIAGTSALINEYKGGDNSELVYQLKKYLEDINMQVYNGEHKTLAAHTNEILKCAEKFFAVYGTHFSDKEKYLIMKACEWHDVGKANLVFQSVVNPDIHVAGDVQQIPHGFFSALSFDEEDIAEEMIENNTLEKMMNDGYTIYYRIKEINDAQITKAVELS